LIIASLYRLKHVNAKTRWAQQQQQENLQENTHSREEFSAHLDTVHTE